MKYKLIRNSNAGVIVDNTPVLRDIKDTFEVSFILPEKGVYVTIFRDQSGVEYNATIRDSVVRVPRQILTKSQLVGLTVCLMNSDKIIRSWECQTLKVGTFLSLRKTQWQITAGVDDKRLFERLEEIESKHAEAMTAVNALCEQTTQYKDQTNEYRQELEHFTVEYEKRLTELNEMLMGLKATNEKLAAAYNKATEVINGLSERVYNLEKNYDPTIIE